jgi:hypothetical protein
MLHASVLVANAHTAHDDSDRSKRTLHNSHGSPLLKRRAIALEEAASRMELEAKAAVLRCWRGQAAVPALAPRPAPALQVPYVERRHVLRQLHVAANRPLAPVLSVLGVPAATERALSWALLSRHGAAKEAGAARSLPGR